MLTSNLFAVANLVEEYIYRLCFSQNGYPPLFFHTGEWEAELPLKGLG